MLCIRDGVTGCHSARHLGGNHRAQEVSDLVGKPMGIIAARHS